MRQKSKLKILQYRNEMLHFSANQVPVLNSWRILCEMPKSFLCTAAGCCNLGECSNGHFVLNWEIWSSVGTLFRVHLECIFCSEEFHIILNVL